MKDTYRGILRVQDWDRFFAVTIMAPSGRRPWPIQNTSAPVKYAEDKPIEIAFTYPIRFIPAGKRKPVVARVSERGSVMLRTAASSSLDKVCTIRSFSLSGDTTDVVSFDGDLWWSLPGRPTASRFAAALREREHSAVGLLAPNCVSTMGAAASWEDLNAREIIHDGRDECLASLQSGAEGILVSDNQVYLRERAPLYVLWNGYWNRSIASVAPSNVTVELASSRRNPAFDDISNELIFGRPFEATDHANVLDSAIVKGRSRLIQKAPKMDIFRPELLHQDPLKIQLEATTRKLLRLVSLPRQGVEDGLSEIRAERQRLRGIVEREGSSFAYGRGLSRFLDWALLEPQGWRRKFRLEKLFIRDAIDRIELECHRRGEASPFATTALDREDDEAIAKFFKGDGAGTAM